MFLYLWPFDLGPGQHAGPGAGLHGEHEGALPSHRDPCSSHSSLCGSLCPGRRSRSIPGECSESQKNMAPLPGPSVYLELGGGCGCLYIKIQIHDEVEF